ncbi:hypothetical protein FOC4_g10000361 [Fusarium odoratissimum]|uniref:2-dehydropantoate 2-reductase n=1 Tax=Fusarium oxysporum f. sp. cubense (strain race 4) TaxID=2502994 RepID=N1RST1_FUSC4|nr:hypothetical protein FOC4_g10000361 [Fusarium odoratissimum]
MSNVVKKNVLLIGGGSVGTIAALNLEAGGLANVTLVLRSNYNVVNDKGFDIESCDHGAIKGWKPSIVRNTIPDILKENIEPYDYIVLSTKNTPDIPPTIVDLVQPALPSTNAHTTLVLIQNGLNIEKPFLQSHPKTVVLSGVSLIGSAEPSPGKIVQGGRDRLLIGAFANPNLDSTSPADDAAREFVEIYAKAGKTDYGAVANLVRPAMREIVEAAKKSAGVNLGDDVMDFLIGADVLQPCLSPSMLADVQKGNFIEFENLLGEPLREEGKTVGVAMPTLEVLYQIAKAVQWRTKEQRHLI